MKIEIWSDVMCPFCYIGKRKFEKALEQFPQKNAIVVEWKSFQLSPDMETDPSKSIYQFLADHKGMSLQQAQSMNSQVSQIAMNAGLTFNFDQAIVANSFNAHRFAHYAKSNNKQNEAEELLFKAYFTEGKNIDDYDVLIELGTKIGLTADGVRSALESDLFAADVKADIAEGQLLGVRGVPFFVFNRKAAISGAQESVVFLQTIESTYSEWKQENPAALNSIEGPGCTTDGGCD
ncbi:MAG: DsbA family oxidoreductase [Flavobacterium sp.]|nr:DsbA family oxidoreductase [Flavobacterium sp.]